MKNKASVASRLQQAMELRGIKQVDLCERTEIGKSSISTYLSGEYEPKQRNLYKIAEVLEVSVSWLMGYDVPMNGDDPTPEVVSFESNGDVMALREQLRRQPGMRILFDAGKTATEQDLLDAAALLENFRKRREGEE